ncbi:MAG: isoleucine--tRNA ligase [Alphaproteobacteria bacterium]
MKDYSKTINLPKTDFSMKANLSEKEISWLEFWKKKKVYENLKKNNKNNKKFILHDGPPYANGDLHLGHALNKILKDIICRFKFQNSCDVDFVPGWDCHGLPIEWKVEENYKKSGKNKNQIEISKFRQECRNFAKSWVEIQKNQFNRFGIQTDWKEVYLTMNEDSELTIVSELLKFLESEQLYLGFKPVMWSVVEKTALAEAEIEYHEKKSKAIYVKFPVLNEEENLSVVIWTTTPWTIPCNKAIAFSSKLNYKKVEITDENNHHFLKKGDKIIIAEDLILDFCNTHSIKGFSVQETISSTDLKKYCCEHPFKELGFDFLVRLYEGQHVTAESGSGFVHIAPNHGLEDFEVGIENKLDNSPTVDENGLYTDNIPFFEGIHVFKADDQVIAELKNNNKLISCNDYLHSYPHSWRSKAPLIFRATSQWFISLEKKGLRKKALEEIEKVKWIPSNSKNRILSMVKDRPDWCVSRQRSWGVPITVFISKKNGEPLINKQVNKKILSIIEKEGIGTWFEKPVEYFLSEIKNSNEYVKVNSILDVWFDSGSSHVYVLKNKGIQDQADLYLEGSDQHRGWFQTSLLESCANYGISPFKTVMTHGFVIDEKGKKMSKSMGNVILPSDVIKKYGADILRIWVANSNYVEDIKISYQNLDRQAESYRKIRNTIRFILGNLNKLQVNEMIEHDSLPPLEKFIRHKLFNLNKQINDHYEEFNFYKAFQLIFGFCSQELSSLFFDIRKDALYCESANSIKVRSTKTVMIDVFQCLIRWLCPIIPFTTEEAWQNWLQISENESEISCHYLKKIEIPSIWNDIKLDNHWSKILEIKNLFSYVVEQKRNSKEIKSSLEAKVFIFFKDIEFKKIVEKINMSEILISSEVEISEKFDNDFYFDGDKKIGVKITKEDGEKCPRCWRVFKKSAISKNYLCFRCDELLNEC